MARKRKKLGHLDYESKLYWERLLTLDGLSMERGRSDHLSYVGDGGDLEDIQAVRETPNGRITPDDIDLT
jgi:hypothetical protein